MGPHAWRVVASETVVADRWIRLRADDCRDASDRRIAPYYVLEYPDWISVLALNPEGSAILVEEYRHGAGVIALGTIGGACEPGEDARVAAARELREETGHVAAELIDLGSTWANFGSHTNRVHHFLALGCERVAEQSLDDSEAITVHILPFDGLDERLEQSFHQLTWFRARAWVDTR